MENPKENQNNVGWNEKQPNGRQQRGSCFRDSSVCWAIRYEYLFSFFFRLEKHEEISVFFVGTCSMSQSTRDSAGRSERIFRNVQKRKTKNEPTHGEREIHENGWPHINFGEVFCTALK